MSFAPIYHPAAHTLILGTYPSPKSRAQGFYYGHPQNRFWPLMARLLGQAVPQTIEEKTALIVNSGFALWDTLDTCDIVGASDASITNAVPNDIAALCAKLPVRQVLCNGKTAYKLCCKYHTLTVPVICLPSTSPANAAFSMEKLEAAWGAYLPK